MGGFASSKPMSLALAALLVFLYVFAFLLAVGAESRRSTGRVEPDEYDQRSYCVYDSDASTAYGVAAFLVLLLGHVLVCALTRCLCLGSALSAGRHRSCALAAFIVSWLTFLSAEACLVGGSVRNAYHTKYVGDYIKRDLVSCASLRKGVFAAAAALMLISLVASLVYYWSYKKAATGGFVKHQNEGVGMTDYGLDRGNSGP